MTKTLFLVAFLFSATPAFAQSTTPSDILFILDASGSMEAKVDGKTQMDIAKESLRATLPGIPATVPMALRVYAHRIDKSDKDNSCKDTELLIPFGEGNGPKIDAAVRGLNPRGYTPIAISLKAAAEDFRGRESQHVIILLSDGEETCGGDPVAEAKNLIAQGFKVNIHTIGFRVDATTRAQLKSISDTTGGMYFDATDAASLTSHLQEAAKKASFLEKPKEEGRGQEIRGGSQFADAIQIQPDIEYHLDHHQRVNEFDYFYIVAKKGQVATVSVMTLSHGVDVKEGSQAVENRSPYNGFRVVDETFKEITQSQLIGSDHGKAAKTFPIPVDQKIYILIGSTYDNVHQESPFRIEMANMFDSGSTSDAGDEIAQALEIKDQDYPKNYLMSDADHDWYKIPVKSGEIYDIKVMPETTDLSIYGEVMDTNRVRLGGANSPNNGALLKMENISIAEDGWMYLHFSTYSASKPEGYSLSIKKKNSMAPDEKTKSFPPTILSKTKSVEPHTVQLASQTGMSDKFMDKPVVLKILLGLSLIGNLYLAVRWLLAARRKP